MFQLFRDGKAHTKSELASRTGLARSTISARIAALEAIDLVTLLGASTSDGGRPPNRIVFNTDVGCVLAVDLGATHSTISVTNLAADVLALETYTIDVADGPTAVLDTVLEKGEKLIETASINGRLLGIGIGVPARVEYATGRPINPPIMPGWDRFDIPGYVRSRFDVPVLVDNDVNILALGEHALVWPHIDDLVFVKVATGIGAGIISGGQLQRGSRGSAGDIGHVQVPRSPGSTRPADDERVLGRLASGPAIAEHLRARGIDAVGGADAIALVRAGNQEAIDATRQAGREVGEALASVVNLLNPSVIVLGGSVARAGEHLLAGVREVVYRRALPIASEFLQVVQSQGGATAAVKGASIMVAQRLLAPASIDIWAGA